MPAVRLGRLEEARERGEHDHERHGRERQQRERRVQRHARGHASRRCGSGRAKSSRTLPHAAEHDVGEEHRRAAREHERAERGVEHDEDRDDADDDQQDVERDVHRRSSLVLVGARRAAGPLALAGPALLLDARPLGGA